MGNSTIKIIITGILLLILVILAIKAIKLLLPVAIVLGIAYVIYMLITGKKKIF